MRNTLFSLVSSFYYFFGLIFLLLFLNIIFNNKIYTFNTLYIVFHITGWLF